MIERQRRNWDASTQARELPSYGNPMSWSVTALERAGDGELVDAGTVRSLDSESQAPHASCPSRLIFLSMYSTSWWWSWEPRGEQHLLAGQEVLL